jgi:hypothetical protein
MVRAKRLLSALGRHVAAYSDLVPAAAAEWRADAIRRIALALVGLTLAISAIVIASGWLLLTVWQSPERHWIAAGLVLVLAAGAGLAARLARSPSPLAPQQSRLKSEWEQDLALLGEARKGAPS